MALFLSTFVNRVDKKGRVSVPATFRASLTDQAFQGVVVFRSAAHGCLEGFDYRMMEDISARMDQFDLFSDAQDDLATTIFGDAMPLPFDGEGRIVLPVDLMEYAGIVEQAAFVGLGRKFQIWEPDALKARQSAAREAVRAKGLTVPRGEGR